MNTTRAHISSYGWIMIFLLLGLGLINFADKTVLGLAAVPIIRELHLSPAQYGLVSGGFFLLYSLSSVVMTSWSDRIGTKAVLAMLATTWTIVQVATLFVFSFPTLLLSRVVLGAGEGPSYGTSVSAATPWLPAERRAFGLGMVTFGYAIGPAVFAPPLTFLIVVVGWRYAFALLGGIGLLWVLIWLLIGRDHPDARPVRARETQEKQSRARWSEIRPVLFSRTVLCSTLAAFVSYWVVALYLSWNPVYLVSVRHLRLSDPLYLAGVSLPYVASAIAIIAFGVFADRLYRRTGSQRKSYVYLVTALLIMGALCLYLAVSIPSALGSVIFFTFALIEVSIPILSTVIASVAPTEHRGAVLGIFVAVSTLPGLIAPFMTGLLIQAAGRNVASGFSHAYLLASLFLLIGAIAWKAIARPNEEQLGEKFPRGAPHANP